jgi:predicted component of type VI protein secretion system
MEYGIGGTEGNRETGSESITDLSKNRTLFITQLTDDAPYNPELIQDDVQSLEQVFKLFKPAKEVSFTMEDGSSTTEMLEFNNVGDFGPKGITQQSEYLNSQKQLEDQYRNLSKELKSNKALQAIVSNPETKQAFIDSITALLSDLEQTV